MALIKIFEEYDSYTKSDGTKVTKFKPHEDFDIFITAIDISTGTVAEKRIVEYSKHENLKMYRVYIPELEHEFWVSEDHSLIAYDAELDKIEKVTPKDVLNDKSKYYLIKYNKDSKGESANITSDLVNFLIDQNCTLISCTNVTIEYDPNKTIGYDFTVEDFYTFTTDKGIFVQDSMAVFVPFTKEGIVTAEKLLNPYAPANPRRLKYDFNKDYKYGVCIMTSDPPSEEYSKKYWWWKQTTLNIQGGKYLTTEGRKYIADLIPQDILNNPDIINPEIFQSKINIESLATVLLEHNIDVEIVKDLLDKVQKKVLEVMTIFSKALSMIDLTLTEKIKPLVNELDENDPIDITQKKLDEINKKLKEIILSESEDLSHMLKCGVLKFGQMVQLLAVKGLILSPNGEVILVKENFAEGLDSEKYFEAGHGARMGIVSRAQKTAITGYLQRQMVYASASVELDPNLDDCGTGRTVDILVTEDLSHRIINRYIILDGKKVLVTPELANELIGKRIHLRSPIFCISKKVCRTCYGEDYKLINTTKIGFVAAESLGERFSQEMMKAFHTGGVVSFKFLNPIKESVDTLGIDEKKYNQILEYDGKEKILKAKEDLLFILDKEYYNLNAFLRKVEVSEGIELETILADIQSEKLGETIPFVYDSSVFLYVPTDITLHNKEKYILKYEKGDKIFKTLPITSDVETKAKKVLAVFQGKGTFKDVSHLVTKVYKELQSFGDIILVHIEVLISQLLRCPDDPRYPYRLCKDFSKPPKLYGIKKIPYLESWKRGLEFENITNAIANALTNQEITQESLLDELL